MINRMFEAMMMPAEKLGAFIEGLLVKLTDNLPETSKWM